MGQRANLILVERGRPVVYYTHWRANTLPRDLFWGPRYALPFFRSQRLIEDGTLLDEVWALYRAARSGAGAGWSATSAERMPASSCWSAERNFLPIQRKM